MANKGKAIVVLVTCKSPAEARRIVRAVVTRRLAACGNVIAAPVTSIYRWKGRVEACQGDSANPQIYQRRISPAGKGNSPSAQLRSPRNRCPAHYFRLKSISRLDSGEYPIAPKLLPGLISRSKFRPRPRFHVMKNWFLPCKFRMRRRRTAPPGNLGRRDGRHAQ